MKWQYLEKIGKCEQKKHYIIVLSCIYTFYVFFFFFNLCTMTELQDETTINDSE